MSDERRWEHELRLSDRIAQLEAEVARLQAQCEGLYQSALNNGQDLLQHEAKVARLRSVLTDIIDLLADGPGGPRRITAIDVAQNAIKSMVAEAQKHKLP